MTKRVAIVQSSYIPWKGYFDLIRGVDEFILLDDVQYTRRDWRNRNLIKTPTGLRWLTIPVEAKGRFHQSVRETRVGGGDWAQRHWSTFRQNYARAPCFREFAPRIEELYRASSNERLLSRINRLFIDAICDILGVGTRGLGSLFQRSKGVKGTSKAKKEIYEAEDVTPRDREGVELTIEILKRLRDAVAARKAEFSVIFIPYKPHVDHRLPANHPLVPLLAVGLDHAGITYREP